jgi:antitoxin CptB
MLNEAELRRQIWHSRRGMLELDVLLGPFAANRLALLSDEQQKTYVRLLAHQDPDLFTWFMGHGSSGDKDLDAMVELVKDYARSSTVQG